MNNEQRDKLVTLARGWIGTPWRHAQRKKGYGVDCINFLWDVAQGIGSNLPPIPEKYSRTSYHNEIEIYLDKYLVRTEVKLIEKGSILMFQFSGYNTHVAIASSNHSMIHACRRHKRVLEHEIDGKWKRTLIGAWEVF